MSAIFISGGASGIGRATAIYFESRGWSVGVYDNDEEALAQLKSDFPTIVVGVLDVRDYHQWETALADFCEPHGGSLDVLDNNAGVVSAGELEDISADDIKRQIDIDALGLTYGAKAALPYLKVARRSHLVNVSSASAIYGQPGLATYSAAKAFVSAMTEALDLEWEKHGIRVVSIWPLWTETQMVNESVKSTQTLGVHLTPDQVAEKIWLSTNPTLVGRMSRRIHYSVGIQTILMANASRCVPRFVVRFVNKVLSQ
ncbi:SDR family oxidoreductase [Gordonia sp. HY002]|uniref:SDR family oxidoreductase n=1 Tax=Gordonia zhenghanii TaxID=2911516 RepID=UPI001EF0B287|nr:SDR family oxidoreductase [Gordonia zhenghanii]MCF8572283.1 SDR family oxidoreductase [Gordonia zhenghanii]MCF8606010.1 SDR family oxidoreductase [Gordonia zhenghanii]